MAELIANHITKAYDGRVIIEDISITLHDNELVGILGVSGVGKSTLFHIISGLLKPDGGEILLDGKEIINAGQISYMLQKDLLLPFKTVIDNVALPLVLGGMDKKKAREKAGIHFEQFGLSGSEEQYPAQLSGGMRQRAALLRTYMFSGKAALLDEPFSALDSITKSAMHKWYQEIMEKIQLSTLFITHDIDEAILLSDRIYLLTGNPGKITNEFIIKEAKPRNEGFQLSKDFLEYKKKIMRYLNQ